MRKRNLFIVKALALVSIFLLSACAEEPLGSNDPAGEGYTVTLRLSTTVTPIPETKATAIPARAGSEAEAAGFKYEMVSSDAVTKTPGFTVEMESSRPDSVVVSLGTKAPGTLKNVYAFLFTSDGAFNGRADIGAFTSGVAAYIDFVNVKTTTAKNCRLVVVANDAGAATNYSSSTNFASFSGSYAEFQKLTITNEIKEDEDVPYAGSAIIEQSLSESGVTADVPLCRTLVKVTFNNHTFDIKGGPARSSITLYNAGVRRFATQGNDDYEGTGSTQTIDVVAETAGSNANSVTWYVGENIQPAVASIQTPADRNSSKAPKNACYIRVASAALPTAGNTSPKIGEEYIAPDAKSFTYDYYLGNSSVLTDFALRRHTNYQLSTEISGTLAEQEEIAAEDGRVTLTKTGGESAGLAIGMFGGASGYTTGMGTPSDVTGSYTKLLLLEPNTTRTTITDNVAKQWSTNTTLLQPETRKYWDPTYTLAHIDQTAGLAFDYCHNLTLGGADKGTWYLPTQAQVLAMWSVLRGLQENNSFAYYSAFYSYDYWSSTENAADKVWSVRLDNGCGMYRYFNKSDVVEVRCVRDATSSLSAQVISTSTGYPVIDLSTLNPLGCVLPYSEAVTRREAMYAPGITPSNSEILPVGLDVSGHNGTWNADMSAKYQVMKQDHVVGATDFVTAWDKCKEYTGEGGGAGTWRLPTQRELYMIWILHPQLIGKAGFTAFGATDYRSSTEYQRQQTWYTGFGDGKPDYASKTAALYVRCVRDLM